MRPSWQAVQDDGGARWPQRPTLAIFFDEISTSNYLQIAFVSGPDLLINRFFTEIYLLIKGPGAEKTNAICTKYNWMLKFCQKSIAI